MPGAGPDRARNPRDRARLVLANRPGPPAAGAVVYFSNASAIGLRSSDGLYRFIRGFGKPVVAAHHLFAPSADPDQSGRDWESWLSRLLAPPASSARP